MRWFDQGLNILIVVLCAVRSVSTGYARDSIQLSSSTFKKILPHFDVCIVKVDKHHPHGSNQTQFEKLAALLSQDRRTIVTEIGVQEFGEVQNGDLAHLLGVAKKDMWPVLFIFARNTKSWIAKYQGRFSLNRLRSFVNQHAEVEWSCSACILELDRLVKAHIFDGSLLASEMIYSAQRFVASVSAEDPMILRTANYYLKLMEKIQRIGQPAVGIESDRVLRVLQSKLSPSKKKLMKQHVDILYYSFAGNLWHFQDEEQIEQNYTELQQNTEL